MGINFMGLFMGSHDIKYILVYVEYVLKYLEGVALSNNEGKSVTNFFRKNIFTRFRIPRAIISNGSSRFYACSKPCLKNLV